MKFAKILFGLLSSETKLEFLITALKLMTGRTEENQCTNYQRNSEAHAAIAQLVKSLTANQEVPGSIPGLASHRSFGGPKRTLALFDRSSLTLVLWSVN